jgi:cysteine synthase
MGIVTFIAFTTKSLGIVSTGASDLAIQMARTMKKGSKIETVVVDRRDRYFAEYPNENYVV